MNQVVVKPFYDTDTGSFSYVVHDSSRDAVVIDPLLDFSVPAARVDTRSADAIVAYVREHELSAGWVLETHAHADHLSAGGYLRDALGARIAIGRGIVDVQRRFKQLFGLDDDRTTRAPKLAHGLSTQGATGCPRRRSYTRL